LVQFLNKNRYLETDSLGKLKPYSKTTLEKLIPMLVSLDDSSYIEIEGYSAQKFYQYQAEQASQNAATNVKNYLVSKLKDKKIIVTNYGDAYPIVDDKKDERNSRVEIKIRRR
jgi:outer membrane protein OmpA-like peptidoglycan-associated protein